MTVDEWEKVDHWLENSHEDRWVKLWMVSGGEIISYEGELDRAYPPVVVTDANETRWCLSLAHIHSVKKTDKPEPPAAREAPAPETDKKGFLGFGGPDKPKAPEKPRDDSHPDHRAKAFKAAAAKLAGDVKSSKVTVSKPVDRPTSLGKLLSKAVDPKKLKKHAR